MPAILIVNPAPAFPSYFTAEAFKLDGKPTVQVADLASVTVAAFVPGSWSIKLVDEELERVDLETECDFVAITGKVTQRERMFELARAFRARGRVVIIGGSFASLTPDDVRPHADILVTGELEDIADGFFADLESGAWNDSYAGGKADITKSPVPRWDLYPVSQALWGALQTTRGCPFNCEFCDVIQYQGRKQRHKTMDQIWSELEALSLHCFRSVFLVDDNFTVHRRHANLILDTLIRWNEANPKNAFTYMTQASLDVAREPELLEKCRTAGLKTFFVGVETVNEDSLGETGKKQNLLLPMSEAIGRLLTAGITVKAGMIVGFDHDDPSTFQAMFDFLQGSPLPDVSLGTLVAPRATDLYARLQREGRLTGDVWDATAGSPFSTNIVPLNFTRSELLEGVRALAKRLYEPENFGARMINFIDAYGSDVVNAKPTDPPKSARSALLFYVLKQISARGWGEAQMVKAVLRAATRKPGTLEGIADHFCRYAQARFVLDQLAGPTAPGIVLQPLHA